jgi:hypothetical protein
LAQLIAEAEAAARANATLLAAQKYAAARALAPDDVRLLEAQVYFTCLHDTKAAVAAIDDYLARHSQPETVAGLLGVQLPFLEQLAREAKGLSTYTTDDVDEPPFVYSADVVARWRDAAAAAVARYPQNPLAGCIMAQSAFALGQYDECDRWLAAIRPVYAKPMLTTARFAMSYFADMDTAAKTVLPRLPEFRMVVEAPTARRVFVGCDQGYFDKFGPLLARSFQRTGTDATLHFHVFDADGTRPADTLRSILGERFSLSTEATFVAGSKIAAAYYASARLIRLMQLMERAPAPTIFVDADLVIGASLDPLFARLQDADVALCRMPGRVTLHSQFNASVIGINPTAEGLRFLRGVAGFVAKLIADNSAVWCVDQTALLCTLVNLRRQGAPSRVIATGRPIYDGTLKCALWPQKMAADSPQYKEWQQAIAAFA